MELLALGGVDVPAWGGGRDEAGGWTPVSASEAVDFVGLEGACVGQAASNCFTVSE